MYIVAIAWIYVVLMMSITEETVVAGVMTFALYGILPLTICLYIMDSGRRKRARIAAAHAALTAAGVSDDASRADCGGTSLLQRPAHLHGPLPERPPPRPGPDGTI